MPTGNQRIDSAHYIACLHIHSMHVLTSSCLLGLQCLSSKWGLLKSTASHMIEFLVNEEFLTDAATLQKRELFQEYDYGLSNRFLLRTISLNMKKGGCRACIAGSYPVHHFSQDPRRAADIDIFVEDNDSGNDAVAMLWCEFEKSLLRGITSKLENEASFHAHVRGVDKAFYTPRGSEELRKSLATCLSTDIGELADVHKQLLRDTCTKLPLTWEPRPYQITDTYRWSISAKSSRLLRPINIIRVRTQTDQGQRTFEEVITSGFDFEHCKITLRVNSDMKHEYVFFGKSHDCIVEKRLMLTPTSFSGPSELEATKIQIRRILKYGRRGYAW
jgi:hypothetical protein